MSRFSDHMTESGAPALFDELAESQEYDSGGGFAAVSMVVHRQPDQLGSLTEEGAPGIQVEVQKADLASIRELRDRVRIDSTSVYLVSDVVSEEGGMWQLWCTP